MTAQSRRLLAGLVLVVLASLPAAAQSGTQSKKRRVAILDFDYGTVSSNVAQIFGTRVDVGKGIADILVDRLVTGNVYSVYERKAIDKLLAEQNLSNSNRFDTAGAAKIGKLLGVEAIVTGSVTQFGRDDQQVGMAGGGGRLSRYGVGGLGTKNSKAVVQISARMVDVNTGEVLLVAQGVGQSSRSGVTLTGSGSGPKTIGGGAVDMRSSGFGQTILGEAVNKAVSELAGRLENNAGRLPEVVVEFNGLVADVSGKTLILNVGKRAGVKVGDSYIVRRTAREVKDPATGAVLRRVEDTLGEVVITEVDDLSAVGTFNGSGTPKVGDPVRKH